MRILLIEDDEVLTDVLVDTLQQQRYVVDTVDDGRFGLEYAQSGTYDLLLIDVGLPRLDGISLCQEIRSEGNTTPILLMTAKNAPDEKIRGLDAGADDYLTKPLDIAELHARLRALLRRGEVVPTSVLAIGRLRLDPVSCEVTYGDSPLKLTPKEYSLLELFLRNPTRVFSRSHIIEHLWTFDDPPLEDSVKAHIKGLRRRLKKAGADGWIENVYGLGYKLSPKIDYEALAQPPQGSAAQQNSSKQTVKQETEATVASTVASNASVKDSVEGSVKGSVKESEEGLEAGSVEDSVEQQFQQAMAKLWQQHRHSMAERMSALKQAEDDLKLGALAKDVQQSAAKAAHKLAGVLGMFGQDDGTETARSLETLLSDEATEPSLAQVSALIEQLNTSLAAAEQTLGTTAASPSAALADSPNAISDEVSVSPTVATATILAVDDDPVFLDTLAPLLQPWGFTVKTLSDPAQFWQTLVTVRPDLLILDIEMPNISGIELCQEVRNDNRDNGKWQSLPILFLSARQNASGEVFAAGADDYVVKPVLGPELITRISNRLERSHLIKSLYSRDLITGLANQIQCQQDFKVLIHPETSNQETGKKETGNKKTNLVFALIRVENLNQLNLEYGHSAGHQVLKSWGDKITSQLPDAIASYWGNGEFVLIFTGVEEAWVDNAIAPLLRSFRQQIYTTETDTIDVNKRHRFQAQYTVGLSTFNTGCKTLNELYKAAHNCLKSV